MIVLHHCVGARSFRVLWALEELQVPYELVMLPFPPRVHVPQYLEINPAGTVPTLHDGDVRMTESVAICQYLAERHGGKALTVASDDPAYAPYLSYLSFGEATLTFPQTLILRYGRYESPERRAPRWWRITRDGFSPGSRQSIHFSVPGHSCAGIDSCSPISQLATHSCLRTILNSPAPFERTQMITGRDYGRETPFSGPWLEKGTRPYSWAPRRRPRPSWAELALSLSRSSA
jgi:hypothetical protein